MARVCSTAAHPTGRVLSHKVGTARTRVAMTQEQLVARFGFSVATLRHWERGDRSTQGQALVLLNVIDKNPAVALITLQ